jgi:hypothetical protein
VVTYAHEDTHTDERWDQLHRDYNDSYDNEDSAEINTPEMLDEDNLASILNQPPAKPKMGDIMDNNNEAADIMTKIDMTGDHNVLHEEDIFVKKEMLAHDTNPHDGKNMIIQVARCDDMHTDEDTKYVNNSNRHDAYEAACKMDVDTLDTDDEEYTAVATIDDQKKGLVTTDTLNKTDERTDAVATLAVNNEELDATIALAATKPSVQNVPNALPQKEPSADNVTVAKYEYEKEPGVKYNNTTHDDQEELLADNENEHEYTHNKIVMTNLTETLDAEMMLAYMNENYKRTSQMGDEDEPTADLKDKKPIVCENPYSIDETNREEDVANDEQSNGVPNKKEPRGSP